MTDLSHGAAHWQGRIIPITEAAIPVTDWGVTHSDITYDVVPVWQGAFFRLDDYVTRFMASAAAWRFDVGRDADGVKAALTDMVAASGLRDSYVAMVVSRGKPTIQGSRDPRDCANHFYAWCVPYIHVAKPEMAEQGIDLWVAKRIRRIPEDSVDPTIKNYHWGDFTSGLFEAKDQGYESVILLDHQGNVTEGPGFNLFAVFGDRIVTSGHGVLRGITRRTVLELAVEAGLAPEERPHVEAATVEVDGGGTGFKAFTDGISKVPVQDQIGADRRQG